MNFKHIYYLGTKELRAFLGDPVLLGLIVYSFTLSIYISATSKPDSIHKVPVAIVDEDNSQLSYRIRDSFLLPYFSSPEFISREKMDLGMDRGLYTFAIDIPEDFEKDILAGKSPTIQLNIDATRLSQAFAGNGYIQSMLYKEVNNYLSRESPQSSNPVPLVERTAFNPSREGSWFWAILQIINNVTLISIVLTGAALIREREHGTIEHLLVMPVTAAELMLSKIWPMILAVLVSSIFSLEVIVAILLKVPVKGSLFLFACGTALHLLATTSLGIFMSTVSKSMPQFGLLLMLIILPLQVLSGGMTPRESMPELIGTIMLAAPNTHYVMLSQSILMKGAGFEVVWKNFASLLLIATALFTFSLTRFNKSLQSMS